MAAGLGRWQSAGLRFVHPETGEKMAFQLEKPIKAPWDLNLSHLR